MSKYLGPLLKKFRALGLPLPRFRKKGNKPPGQHGDKRRRKKSSYGLQLQEKQKVRYSYGWRDKQLKNEYIKARAKAGDTGINLLIGSESRLDNLIFRSGLVPTLRCARQLVSQSHFLVENYQEGKEDKTKTVVKKKVNIPSYKVEPGQIISLKKEKMKENKVIKNNLEQNPQPPPYITLDKQKLTINYLRYPTAEELNKNIDPSLVVE